MAINDLLKKAAKKDASDIHLIVGNKPLVRVDGELSELSGESKITASAAKNLIYGVLNKEQQKEFEEKKDLDISYEVKNVGRFRVNLHFEKGNPALAARIIPAEIPTMEDVLMPEVLYDMAKLRQGLIIFTGAAGQGKSTSMAAMIDYINKERKEHIITLEDPVEFLFKNEKSIIEQRELGVDMNSFTSGLKHVVRQDPNVIMVGEMRDLESIALTLTLAETGHLVLTTLHTISAAQAIDRIIDVFPESQQGQIRLQLSMVLAAVVSQDLLLKKGGGRVAAREILVNTPAVANLIRERKTPQIENVIATSSKEGMMTMEQAIKKLDKEGLIETEK